LNLLEEMCILNQCILFQIALHGAVTNISVESIDSSGLENRDHADHVGPLYPQKLALTSPTSVCRFVGLVRSRT
jgi:hypothetical protein